MTRIGRIKADLNSSISENQYNPHHPRSKKSIQMTSIGRIKTDLDSSISENPYNPRHPRSKKTRGSD